MLDIKKPRVAIYTRVSTIHQVDKDSLPMQRKELIAYCNLMLGTDDYEIFEDAGYSGKNTARPSYLRMMDAIRAGKFTHLLVWKIDRISRDILDFCQMYKELHDLGVVFISKQEQFDTSTAMGEAMQKIILVFSELERKIAAERVTATMISRALSGEWNGGPVSYGYIWIEDTGEFILNEYEANIAKMMHDLYDSAIHSLISIARYLNSQGYRTRAGNEWNPSSVKIILSSYWYCGDYVYNQRKGGSRQKPKPESEVIVVPDHHIAIVSREQKDRIIKRLNENSRLSKEKRQTFNAPKHLHIFRGIVRCNVCGQFMTATSNNKARDWEYSKYGCNAKRKNKTECKYSSDPIIGEFAINYILNMLNAQSKSNEIQSPEELQSVLLRGNTFSYIESIDDDGLNDTFNALKSTLSGPIYGKATKVKTKPLESEISSLKEKRAKAERALERLTNLFLYSESAISESEYVVRKASIIGEIEKVDEQIGMMTSDSEDSLLSDEEFARKASEFIIAQKISSREYIWYKSLAMSVDPQILYDFFHQVLDTITMDHGKVVQIVFKNGMKHSFTLK